jgi:uncharacterized protein (UPF0264 family)
MIRLLVSVRSVAEAASALAGGADLIDIKEPGQGSLGRADDRVINEIAALIGDRRPLSMALGELIDDPSLPPQGFQGFVKAGLAGAVQLDWKARLRAMREAVGSRTGLHLVPAAYADWQRAGAPPPEEVLAYAVRKGFPGFLLDTFRKDGSTLLDWVSRKQLVKLSAFAHNAGLFLALAGSLKEKQIHELLPLAPDIIAVRGAACRNGARDAEIDQDAVARLVEIVRGGSGGLARKLTTLTTGKGPATWASSASRGRNSSTIPSSASSSSDVPAATEHDLRRNSASAPAR